MRRRIELEELRGITNADDDVLFLRTVEVIDWICDDFARTNGLPFRVDRVELEHVTTVDLVLDAGLVEQNSLVKRTADVDSLETHAHLADDSRRSRVVHEAVRGMEVVVAGVAGTEVANDRLPRGEIGADKTELAAHRAQPA